MLVAAVAGAGGVIFGAVQAGAAPAAPAVDPSASWTILVYMNADTNVEASLLETMRQASLAGSTKDVNIIALIDRTAEDTGDSQYPDGNLGSIKEWTDAKLIKVGKNDFQELKDLGEIDMGDPQTLAWFVATGINQFPAKHYGLVLSDHGGGIFGFGWDDTAPKDKGGEPSHLTLPEIGIGLKAALGATNVKRLDLFAFHACLMGEYDVAATVAPYADFLLASEEVMWGETFDWKSAMTYLTSNPAAGPAELGKVVVDTGVQPGFPDIVTMALIDLKKVGAVGQALKSLSKAVVDDIDNVASEFGRQREQAIEFGLDPGQAHSPFGMVDLGDLTRRLTNVSNAVKVAANSVSTAIDGAVLELSTGGAAQSATGISIYFPADSRDYDKQYDAFSTSPDWRKALEAYYETGATPGPGGNTTGVPAFESPTADIEIDPDGVLASARLVDGTEDTVVSADLLGGVVGADGNIHHLLVVPATIGAGDAHVIAGGWSFAYLQISDGTNTLDVTTFLEPAAGGIRATIPMLYQSVTGEQAEALLQFTLDPDTGEVTEDPRYFLFDESGAVSQLVPDPGSLVAPLVLVTRPGGDPSFELLSDTGLDATATPGLTVTVPPTGATFHVLLAAFDNGGNVAIASATGVVP